MYLSDRFIAGGLERVHKAPASETSNVNRLGTLQEVSESCREPNDDNSASPSNQAAPHRASIDQHIMGNSGSKKQTFCSAASTIDMHALPLQQPSETDASHTDDATDLYAQLPRHSESLQGPETGNKRTSGSGSTSGKAIAAVPASALQHRIPARRNSMQVTVAAHSANNAAHTTSGTLNAGLMHQSFARRSCAAATSSTGRFNGLIYTSATDSDGHIAMNRSAAMSLGASVAVTVRSSATKVGSLAVGGGGDHMHGRVLRGTGESTATLASMSFSKAMR